MGLCKRRGEEGLSLAGLFPYSLLSRLGLTWSKLSDQKNSETTFAFLNGDYKNAFSFFLLLKKAHCQRFEVYIVTLLKRKPQKMKNFYNFAKNDPIHIFSTLSDPW